MSGSDDVEIATASRAPLNPSDDAGVNKTFRQAQLRRRRCRQCQCQIGRREARFNYLGEETRGPRPTLRIRAVPTLWNPSIRRDQGDEKNHVFMDTFW